MFNTKTKITSVILSSLICSSQIISANPVPNRKIHDTSKEISYENKESWISAHRGKLGILTGMFVPSIATVGIIGLAKLGCIVSNELYKTMLQNKGFTLKNNKYTPQQRGLTWCWLACLEGIYRYYSQGNITQEYINEKITGMKDLYFYIFRFNTQSLGGNLKLLRNKINKCSQDFKFVTATIQSNNANIIEKSILDYYNRIEKQPFSIVDSLVLQEVGDERKVFHMVNIVDINEGTHEITIEDPQIGMSRKQSLENFCRSYPDQLLEMSDIIPLQTIVPRKLNIPDNIQYVENDESIFKMLQ